MNKAEKRSTRIFYNLLGYFVAVASVALATWLKFLAQPTIIPADVPILYLLAIVPTAIFFGFGPALSVCALSFLAYDYYFIPPIHQITSNSPDYLQYHGNPNSSYISCGWRIIQLFGIEPS